jgi:hypothetical protein
MGYKSGGLQGSGADEFAEPRNVYTSFSILCMNNTTVDVRDISFSSSSSPVKIILICLYRSQHQDEGLVFTQP